MISWIVLFLLTISLAGAVLAQTTPMPDPDCDNSVKTARKEGRVVVSLPASAEVRAAIETNFEKRFGVDVEPIVGTAPVIVSRIVQESKAGVHYFDIHLGGSETV